MGFNFVWGYWLLVWFGNVVYVVFLFSLFGYFFKFFGNGNNIILIIGVSIVIWVVYFLILRGVNIVVFINIIVIFVKLVFVIIFLILVLLVFKFNIFSFDIWGNGLY